jgi:hypothetical protein
VYGRRWRWLAARASLAEKDARLSRVGFVDVPEKSSGEDVSGARRTDDVQRACWFKAQIVVYHLDGKDN